MSINIVGIPPKSLKFVFNLFDSMPMHGFLWLAKFVGINQSNKIGEIVDTSKIDCLPDTALG